MDRMDRMVVVILLRLLLLLLTSAVVDAKTHATIPGRPCFRSLEGMLDSMRDLASIHSNLVNISNIGESFLKNGIGRTEGSYTIPTGGHDIYVLNVTDSTSARDSQQKGKMLLASGVHAREWAPPELLARYVEMLVDGYGVDADITWILQHTEIHAILYVNPDGRWMSERYPQTYWRKNLNPGNDDCGNSNYGVDINRNFDFKWGDQAGASDDPCDSDYHGQRGESEPETKAVAEYARSLFPESQRKRNPEDQMNEPFGEDITGVYMDIHSSGGYVYYPWGHKDAKSPDDQALQAIGRKVHSFNEYRLWAGSQPDFVYEASGDSSDYLYAVLGTASMGLEIGNSFQEECASFEGDVVPKNLPPLIYLAKIAQRPFKKAKGPDVFDLKCVYKNEGIHVSARVSDGEMVNDVQGFEDFETGGQKIIRVQLYLDVHPDDSDSNDNSREMLPVGLKRLNSDGNSRSNGVQRSEECSTFNRRRKCKRGGIGSICKWSRRRRKCSRRGSANPGFTSGDADVQLVIDASAMAPGSHTLYVQATDSMGYDGPVSSVFVEVLQRRRESLSRETKVPSN